MWVTLQKFLPFAQTSGIYIVQRLQAYCYAIPLWLYYIMSDVPKSGGVYDVVYQLIKRVDYLNAPHLTNAEQPPFACLVCCQAPDFRFIHLPVAIGLLTSSLEPKWSQIFRSPDQQEQVAQYLESQVYWYIIIPPWSVVFTMIIL